MLKVFQRWARVKEVFISHRHNRWGRRFGFVRLFDVKNAGRLEREMDQAWVGRMKLYVNILRYRRVEQERQECMVNAERSHHAYEQREGSNKEEWRVKKGKEKMEGRALNVKKTYAGVVKKILTRCMEGSMIVTKQLILPWMCNSAVGFFVVDLSYN